MGNRLKLTAFPVLVKYSYYPTPYPLSASGEGNFGASLLGGWGSSDVPHLSENRYILRVPASSPLSPQHPAPLSPQPPAPLLPHLVCIRASVSAPLAPCLQTVEL
jgi:hypothetical protein